MFSLCQRSFICRSLIFLFHSVGLHASLFTPVPICLLSNFTLLFAVKKYESCNFSSFSRLFWLFAIIYGMSFWIVISVKLSLILTGTLSNMEIVTLNLSMYELWVSFHFPYFFYFVVFIHICVYVCVCVYIHINNVLGQSLWLSKISLHLYPICGLKSRLLHVNVPDKTAEDGSCASAPAPMGEIETKLLALAWPSLGHC